MGFEKVEFEFPEGHEEDEGVDVTIAPSSMTALGEEAETETEVEVEVDTEVEAKATVDDRLNEALDIEIVDDTPDEDKNRTPAPIPEDVTEEELKSHGEKIRKRLSGFAKRYHDERREKEAAQREREALEAYTKKVMDENAKLKGAVGKNQAAILDQAKRAVTAEMDSAKADYLKAHEAGDSEALLAAQENLTAVSIRAEKINNIKLPSLQEEADEVQLPQTTQTSQEAAAPAQAQVDPQAKTWAAENSWFGTDEEMTGFALVVHNKLVNRGVSPQSEEYYEEINSRMRQVFPDNFKETQEEEKPARKKPSVVAPATRSTSAKSIKLTKSQVAISKRLGVPLEDYARQVAEDMKKERQNG